MPIMVRISDDIATEARIRAAAMSRSVNGQVEYWAKIGRIAEDNPDLPFSVIQGLLISIEQAKNSELEDYQFGEGEES